MLRILFKPSLFLAGLLVALAACSPPTPPPSPTPWPTAARMETGVARRVTPTGSASVTATATPTPRTKATPTSANTTLVVWASLPEAQTQALAEDIRAFQDEFPQFEVKLQHYDSPETFATQLGADDIRFDVVLAAPNLLGHLWAERQVAPMSEFFPPSFIGGFEPVTLLGARRDNELWGLPDTAGFHLLLYYNRDLVDTPPANTDELSRLAQNVMRRGRSQGETSLWGLGVNSNDPLWLLPWLPPYGGWLTDESGQPTLDTPAMEAALTLFLSWQGPSTSIAPVESYDEVRTQFLRGDMAMMIDGEWAIGELARVTSVDWQVARLPSVGQANKSQPASPLVLARYWAISRTATDDRALAAAIFLEHVTRPERQLARIAQFGLLPTRLQALEDPTIVNDPILRVSAAQMQAGRAIPLGIDPNTILDAMREPLQGVIEGELTPREAAEQMQRNVDR